MVQSRSDARPQGPTAQRGPRVQAGAWLVALLAVAVALAGCVETLTGDGGTIESEGESDAANRTLPVPERQRDFTKNCQEGHRFDFINFYTNPMTEQFHFCWQQPNQTEIMWRIAKPVFGTFDVKVEDPDGELFYHQRWGYGAGSDCTDEGKMGTPGNYSVTITLWDLEGRVRALFHTDDIGECPS